MSLASPNEFCFWSVPMNPEHSLVSIGLPLQGLQAVEETMGRVSPQRPVMLGGGGDGPDSMGSHPTPTPGFSGGTFHTY